jgi:hypothetical protein
MKQTKNEKLSIITRQDSMTLKTPNGSFTMGYGGERMSGNMVNVPGLFKKMVNYVNSLMKSGKFKNFGDAFSTLANPKVMSALWPDWNKIEGNPFKIGDAVTFIDAKLSKKYGAGVVTDIKKQNVVVKFPEGPKVQTPFNMLKNSRL